MFVCLLNSPQTIFSSHVAQFVFAILGMSTGECLRISLGTEFMSVVNRYYCTSIVSDMLDIKREL